MPQSIDTLRVGHRYALINYGEKSEFMLIEIRNHSDYIIKDLHSLEIYNLKVLIEYGIGRDYNLYEIEDN